MKEANEEERNEIKGKTKKEREKGLGRQYAILTRIVKRYSETLLGNDKSLSSALVLLLTIEKQLFH